MPAWTCPRCRKSFDLPEGWETPKVCSECVQARKAGPPKAPVPPKPVAVAVPESAGVETDAPAKKQFSIQRLIVIVAVVLMIPVVTALAAMGLSWNSDFEDANAEGRRLNKLLVEADHKRHEKQLNEALSAKPPVPLADQPITGDLVVIGADEDQLTILVRHWHDHEEMAKFLRAKDNFGIKEMFQQERAFAVKSGTVAKVLDTGFQAFELRIQDGDQAGKSGWLEKDYFVKKK